MPYIVITDANITETLKKTNLPVILYFWAEWCVPCKTVGPILDLLSEEYADKVVVGKINADENQETVDTLTIMSLPTIVIFKNGEPVQSLVGAHSKQQYKVEIEKIL